MSQGLGRLITDLGDRSTYDAASQCSRCGYCEQACPTYVATGRESQSGRGRNQLVRLMLEGKLSDLGAAEEALSTCLLCGACTTACYAHVPTADIVLEGRRALAEKPPWLVRVLTWLLVGHRDALSLLLKSSYLLKRAGLSRLARPFLRLAGFDGLAEADAHVDETPSRFLFEELGRRKRPAEPRWLYFAPCGPNYLYPRVGLATVSALESTRGPGAFLDNGCCGLLPYNYGEVEDARCLARAVIEKSEKSGAGLPVVADCSSCTAFLKSYPQLFLEEPAWRARAERFAESVQDAVEAFSGADIEPSTSAETVTYHESCRACHGQGLPAPAQLLSRACGDKFTELPESSVCCGGAGAFSFVHPELSDEVLKRKIGAVARTRASLVLTSSTSCLIQLAHGLKKYYPQGRVMHLSEFVAKRLSQGKPEHHGTTTGA
ncbi:MAG: (Fe-S)-binding protein [Elusimicrobia bacterium]|nr:(Fe-S)-binding protein [Elusimicrobiota bacterium]